MLEMRNFTGRVFSYLIYGHLNNNQTNSKTENILVFSKIYCNVDNKSRLNLSLLFSDLIYHNLKTDHVRMRRRETRRLIRFDIQPLASVMRKDTFGHMQKVQKV